MFLILCRFLLVSLLFAISVQAAELQAEGAVDTRIGLSRRWDVVLHNRARMLATEGDWFDVSLIPIFRYRAHRKVTVLAGHFFTWYDFGESGWSNVYRPFGGAEFTQRYKRINLASRTLVERFFVTGGRDRNRYRQRFRLTANGSWAPYGSVEFFFDNNGFLTTRYGTGIRKNLSERDGIEFGYWYEAGKLADRGIRHMVVATFHLNFKGFAPDI